jgi:hypothetical protein
MANEANTVAAPELMAWSSIDGEQWSTALPALALPEGASVVGAGLAWERQGWQAAVLYRSAAGARLGFASAASCDSWSPVSEGIPLFDDAEAPSYVPSDRAGSIYFTRPPTDQTRRTLWRLPLAAPAEPAGEAELVAELPVGVEPPVSLQQLGSRDLVLVSPSQLGAWGVSVLVSDDSQGHSWTAVGPSPLLAIPAQGDAELGQSSFDDRGVTAAALHWDGSTGFFLYAGTSANGWTGSSNVQVMSSVGTARLSHGAEEPEPRPGRPRLPSPPAGNIAITGDWEIPVGSRAYWDAARGALSWVAGSWFVASPEDESNAPPDTLLRLPLDGALIGDFELSFDLWTSALSNEWCPIDIGLEGAGTRLWTRIDDDQDGQYLVAPASSLADVTGVTDWSKVSYGNTLETLLRLKLRREGRSLGLSIEPAPACGSGTEPRTLLDPIPPLTHLFVQYPNRCPRGASFTVSNVRLNALTDPEACPPSTQRCAEQGQQPACVDTSVSLEHCGGCGVTCAKNQSCHAGVCGCTDELAVAALCPRGGTDCGEATPIAGTQLTLLLDEVGGQSDAALCNVAVQRRVIYRWTAEQTGRVQVNGPHGSMVAVTDDSSCARWLQCSRPPVQPLPLIGDVNLAVSAGQTYLIGVGWDPAVAAAGARGETEYGIAVPNAFELRME